MRIIILILALLGGPFGCKCLPNAGDRATNSSIGGLMAYDLDQCIKAAPSGPEGWTVFDTCSAALTACATNAKTVADYDACSDRVVR